MPTLRHLIEVARFAQNRTLSQADGDLLGVVETAHWLKSDARLPGGALTIGSKRYAVDRILEIDSPMHVLCADGKTAFRPAPRAALEVVLLEVSAGPERRAFVVPVERNTPWPEIRAIRFGFFGDVMGGGAAGAPEENVFRSTASHAKLLMAAGREVPVDRVRPGDLAQTRAGGAQPVRWIGQSHVPPRSEDTPLAERPVRIGPSALGPGLPKGPIVLAPGHRIWVHSQHAQSLFGGAEVLVTARDLTALEGIDFIGDDESTDVFHILFDQHHLVEISGALVESFFPGPANLEALSRADRKAIFEIMPGLMDPEQTMATSGRMVSGHKGRQLARRHAETGVPLIERGAEPDILEAIARVSAG